jgi:NADH:ubiquinone oxidoreductase subunit K
MLSTYFVLVSSVVFALGFAVLVTKKNLIMMLMGVELMLNSVNINFVAFSRNAIDPFEGQLFSLFLMIIAASEVAVALAIILKLKEHYKTINPDMLDELKN